MNRAFHTKTSVQRLRELELFAACSTKELRRMEQFMTEVQVPAGRVLTTCAEPAKEFFIVVRGTASVWRDGVRLEVVGPGGFFGELSLLDHGTRTASVI